MIKGCRKRMVIVSGLNDSSFEVAYFVMRDGEDEKIPSDRDILEKANSIIENSFSDTSEFSISERKNKKRRKKHRAKNIIIFSLGFIFGGFALAFFKLFSLF